MNDNAIDSSEHYPCAEIIDAYSAHAFIQSRPYELPKACSTGIGEAVRCSPFLSAIGRFDTALI